MSGRNDRFSFRHSDVLLPSRLALTTPVSTTSQFCIWIFAGGCSPTARAAGVISQFWPAKLVRSTSISFRSAGKCTEPGDRFTEMRDSHASHDFLGEVIRCLRDYILADE